MSVSDKIDEGHYDQTLSFYTFNEQEKDDDCQKTLQDP